MILLFPTVASAQKTCLYKTYDKQTLRVLERSRVRFDHSQPGVIQAAFEQGISDDYPQKEEYIFDKDYKTLRWSVKNSQTSTDYTGSKEGKKIILKGTFNNKPISKELPIDDTGPFYAFPKIELTPFVLSDKKKLLFWAMRNDTLEVYKMIATPQGEEKIIVNGKMVNAKKVYWSPVNPLFRIFQRTYYYRASDGIFLKQEYPDGRVRELVGEE